MPTVESVAAVVRTQHNEKEGKRPTQTADTFVEDLRRFHDRRPADRRGFLESLIARVQQSADPSTSVNANVSDDEHWPRVARWLEREGPEVPRHPISTSDLW